MTSVLFVSSSIGAGAQVAGNPNVPPGLSATNAQERLQQGSALRLSVVTDNKARLDRQAVAKLHCDYPETTLYQTTGGDSETTFFGLKFGKYDLEISAVGYLSAHERVEITGLADTSELRVVLQRDPMAINFDSSGAVDALMPAKTSKEVERALKALKSGNPKDARKHLDAAYKLSPSSSRVNFLLGYQSVQDKNFDQAQSYLTRSTELDPQNAQALTLLGRVEVVREQYSDAVTTLERAIAVDPQDWLSQALLADAYLKQKQYEKARDHARAALDKGQAAANMAQLSLGEAQANLGNTQEAIQALKIYLQAFPASLVAGQVQQFIASLEHPPVTSASLVAPVQIPSPSSSVGSLESMDSGLSYSWQPPGIDQSKPAVAAGVTCPTDQVLKSTGVNVQELVENVGRFAAIEDLLHENLDKFGNVRSREVRKFEYAANVSESRPGYLMVDEYRTQRYGIDVLPGQIVTAGFPAMALIFHPIMQGNFDLVCEGLGEWRGQATWLVHFKQREDRPSRIQSFRTPNNSYPVNLKGRVWISADHFQIVRMESELVHPMREIQFLAQHSITEYGPVHFQKKNVDIWLPKSAEVYLDLRHHLYYRRHSFDHYMLFSVDSDQKVREAKHPPNGPGSINPRKRRRYKEA